MAHLLLGKADLTQHQSPLARQGPRALARSWVPRDEADRREGCRGVGSSRSKQLSTNVRVWVECARAWWGEYMRMWFWKVEPQSMGNVFFQPSQWVGREGIRKLSQLRTPPGLSSMPISAPLSALLSLGHLIQINWHVLTIPFLSPN